MIQRNPPKPALANHRLVHRHRPGPVGMCRRPRLPCAGGPQGGRRERTPTRPRRVAGDGRPARPARPTCRNASSTGRTSPPPGGRRSSRRRSTRWCSPRSRNSPTVDGCPGRAAPGRGKLPRRLRLEGVPVGHGPSSNAARQRYALAAVGATIPAGYTANLFQAGSRRVVHAGHRRRQPTRARRRARGHRLPALPGRGHLAQPDVQRGGHGHPGGLAARADQGHAGHRAGQRQTKSLKRDFDAQVQPRRPRARGALLQQQTLIAQATGAAAAAREGARADAPPARGARRPPAGRGRPAHVRHRLAGAAARAAAVRARRRSYASARTCARARRSCTRRARRSAWPRPALYPQITLSAGIDRQSFKIGKLFDTGTTGWSLAGGTRAAAVQRRRAAGEEASRGRRVRRRAGAVPGDRAQRVPQRGQHAARDRHRRRLRGGHGRRRAPRRRVAGRWSCASTSWAR